jgi:hypothetical protein
VQSYPELPHLGCYSKSETFRIILEFSGEFCHQFLRVPLGFGFMKATSFFAVGFCLQALCWTPLQAQTLFSDNYDSFVVPSTVTSSGTANGYIIRTGAGSGGEDFKAVFGFDYSTVSIPSAPNAGGTTRGLQLFVNKNDATAANTAVNLYPVGQSFSGSYALKFDVWMNYNNSDAFASTTEHALFGINHSGNVTNRVAGAGSDGLFYAMSGDGGSSPTSTTARDYSVFQGQGATAPLLLRTNNFTFGPTPPLGLQFDNTNGGFVTLFPAAGNPYGLPGVPGLRWVQGEVRQEGNLITWSLDNTIVAQYTNSTAYTSGDIMLGYNDIFTSISAADAYLIFDDVRVEAIPEPGMCSFLCLGAIVAYRCFRRRSDFVRS